MAEQKLRPANWDTPFGRQLRMEEEPVMTTEPFGSVIGRGKTKIIHATDDYRAVDLEATPDITAGDGKKHDQMEGKPELATRTTCNVFRLLNRCGIPTAFIRQVNPTTFRAWKTKMVLFEVVVRCEAEGSALEREPELQKYQVFDPPRVEFFLKTTGKQWQGITISVDDPYVVDRGDGKLDLYDPHAPLAGQTPFLTIDDFSSPQQREQMANIAVRATRALQAAWAKINGRFIDVKFEFGISESGELLLSDVVDNDSWRVVYGGRDVSKQGYREGEKLPTVKGKYELVAQLTDGF